jgi:hypothetical protein
MQSFAKLMAEKANDPSLQEFNKVMAKQYGMEVNDSETS